MEEGRNTEGQYTPEHTDEEILAAVRAHDPAATSEVAVEVGMTRQGADRRLRSLRDAGRVNSKKIGASLVWFVPPDRRTDDRPEEPDAGAEASARARDTTEDTVDDARGAAGDTRPPNADESDAIGEALDGWEPDTEADPRSARPQTRRAAEWLRDVGEYRRAGALKDALAGDAELTARVWWERHVRPGLKHLADADLVEYTKNRGYRWSG